MSLCYDVTIEIAYTQLMKIPSPKKAREIKDAFEQKKAELEFQKKEEFRLEKKQKLEIRRICKEIVQNGFQASLKGQTYLLVAQADIGADQAAVIRELEARGFLLSKIKDIMLIH